MKKTQSFNDIMNNVMLQRDMAYLFIKHCELQKEYKKLFLRQVGLE